MTLRIKEVVKERGLQVSDLATMLGINRVSLSQQINGNPTIETLQKIADALNVHISDLFDKPQAEEISGFVKVKGEVKEIKSKKDLEDILNNL